MKLLDERICQLKFAEIQKVNLGYFKICAKENSK